MTALASSSALREPVRGLVSVGDEQRVWRSAPDLMGCTKRTIPSDSVGLCVVWSAGCGT